MRVFLDTNVLVSAFATRGICADVLRVVIAEHTLVTSEVILEELGRALRKRIGLPAAAIKEIDEFLRDNEVGPRPTSPAAIPKRDPDDRWVLASAIDGRNLSTCLRHSAVAFTVLPRTS